MVPHKKSIGGRLGALTLGLFITIFLTELILRFAMPNWTEFWSGNFMREISVPGYGTVGTGLPNFNGYFSQNNGDFRVHISINKFGLRNPEPISASNNAIWVVGDSMTFGWGVEQQEMYSSVLEKLLNYPVYNIASPGTGVCGYQALISRMPKNFSPQALVIGLVLENDISASECKKRNSEEEGLAETHKTSLAKNRQKSILSLSNVKRKLTNISALYNFIAVSLKRIEIINRALVMLGIIKPVEIYRSPITKENLVSAVDVTADKILKLKQMMPENIPVSVLIIPGRFEIRDEDPLYRTLRQMMHRALNKRTVDVVDPFDEFVAVGYSATHFKHDGHWSSLGHKIAGKEIADKLKYLNTGIK